MRALCLLVGGLVIASGGLAGCVSGPGDAGAGADAGTVAWRVVDTEGAVHSNGTTRGAPVVLFFMATWCSSCQSKAPMLGDVHADTAPDGVQWVSVDVDPTETADDLAAWKKEHGHDWPHGVESDGNVTRAFGIRAQSSLVVLDATGREVAKWQYPGASEDALRAAIADALEGDARDA